MKRRRGALPLSSKHAKESRFLFRRPHPAAERTYASRSSTLRWTGCAQEVNRGLCAGPGRRARGRGTEEAVRTIALLADGLPGRSGCHGSDRRVLEAGLERSGTAEAVQAEAGQRPAFSRGGRQEDRSGRCRLAGRAAAVGLLKASFLPPREIRALRDPTRLRVSLLQDQNRVQNRIEKILEDANINRSSPSS